MYVSKKIIAFFDADPAGIMFFGNLFRYIHTVYEEMLNSSDTGINYFSHNKIVLPITHTEADYIAPFFMHEAIEIKIRVSSLRTSSFELSYQIFGKDNKLKATAKTVHVCVKKSDMQKCNLPDELMSFLVSLK